MPTDPVTRSNGPPALPIIAPPDNPSGNVSPLAAPTTVGALKRLSATRTAVSNRSAPTMGVAVGAACAAGPPIATYWAPEWSRRYFATAGGNVEPFVSSRKPPAAAAAAPADSASGNDR